MAQIKTDLKIEAIKEAHKKALGMTSALGQNCGRAIYILEYQMPRTTFVPNRLMRSSA